MQDISYLDFSCKVWLLLSSDKDVKTHFLLGVVDYRYLLGVLLVVASVDDEPQGRSLDLLVWWVLEGFWEDMWDLIESQ